MRGKMDAVSEKQDLTEVKQQVARVQPRMSAAIHARFPYLFQDVQSPPQEQDGGQLSAAGDPASSGRNSPKIASRSLLVLSLPPFLLFSFTLCFIILYQLSPPFLIFFSLHSLTPLSFYCNFSTVISRCKVFFLGGFHFLQKNAKMFKFGLVQ